MRLIIKRIKIRNWVSKTYHGLFIGGMVILSFLYLNLRGSVYAGIPENIRQTNVRDVTFAVSWITDVDKIGQINYGANPADLSNVAYDDRGESIYKHSHHITVSGLIPNTTYYYDVVSGGLTYNNGGSHFNCTTASILAPPPSDLIFGQVYKSDGLTPAEGAIIYIIVEDNDGQGGCGQSQVLSTLVDANAYWHINIGTVRTKDLFSYFIYSLSGDKVGISAQEREDKTVSQTIDTGNDFPAPDMILPR